MRRRRQKGDASIPERLPVFDAQRSVLVGAVERALPDPTSGQFKLFAHVAWCQFRRPRDYADGVPVPYYVVEPLDEDRSRHSAKAVWEPLADAGLIQVTPYQLGSGKTPGRCRHFAVPGELLDALTAAAPTVSDVPLRRVDLFTGKRSRVKPKGSDLRENGKLVGSNLYREAVGTLEWGAFHAPSVKVHLGRLENECDEAHRAWEAAGSTEFTPEAEFHLDIARRALEADGLRWTPAAIADAVSDYEDRHGPARTPEFVAARWARGRWLNDVRCYEAVLAQGAEPTGEPGEYRYRLRYRHQTSGRAGAVGGALQSCSRAMKQAAYDPLDDVYNYDLVASQPNVLVELFDEANAHRTPPSPPLDASWLDQYTSDPEAKSSYAKDVGVSVRTWKRALCAVLMGAWIARDPVQSDGEVASEFKGDPACGSLGTLAAAWGQLRLVLGVGAGGFYDELRRWREWTGRVLVIDGECSGPHRSGGRWVGNAAGETYHWEPDRPEHERQAELAAHLLQGKEAAFILNLIKLAERHGFEVLAHEHDGVVTRGVVPPAAIAEARTASGVRRADLVKKSFV